jgi:hypothetical protein
MTCQTHALNGVYAFSLGLWLVAGMVDVLGAFALVSWLKPEVAALVSWFKSKVTSLKSEVTSLKSEVTSLKSEVASEVAGRNCRHSSWVDNPLLNAASLLFVGVWLTSAATSVFNSTIMQDLDRAPTVGQFRSSARPALLEDAEQDRDSSLAIAVAVQARHAGSVCAGLGKDDSVGVLPGGRAIVRRAAKFRPDEYSSRTLWPLTQVYFRDCNQAASAR